LKLLIRTNRIFQSFVLGKSISSGNLAFASSSRGRVVVGFRLIDDIAVLELALRSKKVLELVLGHAPVDVSDVKLRL